MNPHTHRAEHDRPHVGPPDRRTDPDAALGGPSAKTFHQPGADSTPNHQVDSKETRHV